MFDTVAEKKFLLKQLVKRDLTSKFKDSVLEIAWSFLNPLLIMIVFMMHPFGMVIFDIRVPLIIAQILGKRK